jgi:hypothetical protein
MIWEMAGVKATGAAGVEVETRKFYLPGLRETATVEPHIALGRGLAFRTSRY